MKTTEVFFEGTNFVGRQIENVQDLVKALAAGMDIVPDYDYYGYSRFYDKDIEDEFGNTTCEEVEKTPDELFEEMKGDLDNGKTLYAGFFLDYREFSIKPAKKTTLQTDFSVGQEVYMLADNKVIKTKIEQLLLIEGENSFPSSNTMARDFTSTLYERCNTRYTNKPTHEYICQEIDRVRVPERSSVCVKINGYYTMVELSKIFATKEELVEHLMEE